MSHTVQVNLIADQEIKINGEEVNVHDIESIFLNSDGVISCITKKKDGSIGCVKKEKNRGTKDQFVDTFNMQNKKFDFDRFKHIKTSVTVFKKMPYFMEDRCVFGTLVVEDIRHKGEEFTMTTFYVDKYTARAFGYDKWYTKKQAIKDSWVRVCMHAGGVPEKGEVSTITV